MNHRNRSGKIVSIYLSSLEVDIDLGEIDTDDILEELERRKGVPAVSNKTDVEQRTILDRFWEQRRRFHTHSPGVVTPEEREFWFHVHGRDL